MNELISLIVPIYKVEKYLIRCIDSAINQTYTNLEIILVDDGSPDKCGDICDKYALSDFRVKVIHKDNGGLSDARNEGIKLSKGKYISFLDSDDWIDENYVEKLYQLLKSSDSDISILNYFKTSDNHIQIDIIKEEIQILTNIQAIGKMYDKKTKVQMIVSWGKLYKKRLFKNIKFPIGKIHEDEFTTYKLFYYSKKIIISSAKMLYYTQRKDSIVGSVFNIKNHSDAYEAFEERLNFFKLREQHELYNRTCKEMFLYYTETIKKISANNVTTSFDEISLKSNNLRISLRASRQKMQFKVFYELYFTVLDFRRR